jgi:hypothetical protein
LSLPPILGIMGAAAAGAKEAVVEGESFTPSYPPLDEGVVRTLLAIARREMDQQVAGRIGPEDILQSVFMSLWTLPRNLDVRSLPPQQLAKLLAYRTRLHAWKRMRKEKSQPRDPSREEPRGAGGEADGVTQPEPADYRAIDPSEEAALHELWDWLSARLSPTERQILELSVELHDKLAIAKCVGRGTKTVERALGKIKAMLIAGFPPGR